MGTDVTSLERRAATSAPAAPTGYRRLLADRGFAALMVAQFLGALNDNLLKIAIMLAATSAATVSAVTIGATAPAEIAAADWMHNTTTLVPLAGAAFILPYLIFSGIAGQIA